MQNIAVMLGGMFTEAFTGFFFREAGRGAKFLENIFGPPPPNEIVSPPNVIFYFIFSLSLQVSKKHIF